MIFKPILAIGANEPNQACTLNQLYCTISANVDQKLTSIHRLAIKSFNSGGCDRVVAVNCGCVEKQGMAFQASLALN
jgi:hypothetical protein